MDVNMHSRIYKSIYRISKSYSLKITSKKLLYIKLANKSLRLGGCSKYWLQPPFWIAFSPIYFNPMVDLSLIISGKWEPLNINCRLKIHICSPTDKDRHVWNWMKGLSIARQQCLLGTPLYIQSHLKVASHKELLNSCYRLTKMLFD